MILNSAGIKWTILFSWMLLKKVVFVQEDTSMEMAYRESMFNKDWKHEQQEKRHEGEDLWRRRIYYTYDIWREMKSHGPICDLLENTWGYCGQGTEIEYSTRAAPRLFLFSFSVERAIMMSSTWTVDYPSLLSL